MFTRLMCAAVAVVVLAAGAQAQSPKGGKTVPQTKSFVPVKQPVFVPPIYKVPVYHPPIFYPPYYPPVYKYPVYKPYFPSYPKYPWYGW